MGDNVKTRQGSRWSLKSTLRLSSRKGHVLLVVNDQVRRVCLPERITHLDTVRALFVRAFPQAVTWDSFKNPANNSNAKGLPPTILVLNPNVNLFYQLSDLSQVKHGCVLKLSPAGATLPHSSSAHSNCVANADPPPVPSVHHSHSDTELELRLAGMNSKSGHPPTSQQQQQLQQHHRHCTKAGASGTTQAPNSPKRLHHSQTHPGMPDPPGHPPHQHQELVCTCPPEFHQMLYEHQLLQQHQHQMATAASSARVAAGQSLLLDGGAYPPAYSAPPVPPHPSSIDMNGAANSGLPVGILPPELEASFLAEQAGHKPQSRMALMEAQLAHLTAWVQTLQASGVAPCPPPGPLPPSVVGQQAFTPSNSSLDSAYSARSTTSSDASTSQSTQTPPFPRRGLAHPPAGLSPGMRQKMAHIQTQVGSLKEEWAGLRNLQLETQAAFRKEMETALQQMQYVVASIPGAREEPIRAERCRLEEALREYKEEVARVETRLRDLEMAVEEVRGDVLTRKCRVNGQEVENLALHLSHVSQALANLKTSRLPPLCSRLKTLLHAEMDTAMRDEGFLKTEAASIEKTLKRCKKLIGMLFTLKKLSGVQNRDQRDVDDDFGRLSDGGAESEEDELLPLPPPPPPQELQALQPPTGSRKAGGGPSGPVVPPPISSAGVPANASTSSNSSSASSATPATTGQAPILKTSSSSSSGQTQKGVAFSKTVLVEDGSHRELNDDDDDEYDNDLNNPGDCGPGEPPHHGPNNSGSKRTPPPPPPRRNSRGISSGANPDANGTAEGAAAVPGRPGGPNTNEVWQRRRDGSSEPNPMPAAVKKFAS